MADSKPRKKSRDKALEAALESAVLGGDGEGLRALLEEGADPNTLLPRRRRTLLMLAVAEDQTEGAAVLLQAGADPLPEGIDPHDHAGFDRVPLVVALRQKNVELSRRLAEACGRERLKIAAVRLLFVALQSGDAELESFAHLVPFVADQDDLQLALMSIASAPTTFAAMKTEQFARALAILKANGADFDAVLPGKTVSLRQAFQTSGKAKLLEALERAETGS